MLNNNCAQTKLSFINNPSNILIEKREWYEYLKNDISPLCKPSTEASRIAQALSQLDASPLAIAYFAENCHLLPDYHYWYILGTCWINYTGWSELELWKELFSSTRKNRGPSLMKPKEWNIFRHILPKTIHCYRIHRKDEKDWISYTLDLDTAIWIAKSRGIDAIHEYIINKKDLIALFLRRHEYEVLCLNKGKAQLVEIVKM